RDRHGSGVVTGRSRQRRLHWSRMSGSVAVELAKALFVNANAADAETRQQVTTLLRERGARVRVLMHSLAFGTLRPYIDEDASQEVTQKQLEMTLDAWRTRWSTGRRSCSMPACSSAMRASSP
ncbi:hypothetical protein, partial [Streptococcus pneumoniae]|uniref:hypothetical protein n=1 Tax=Streptococcus pneumoniae TaxID=1313 RepID=UPI001CB7AC90